MLRLRVLFLPFFAANAVTVQRVLLMCAVASADGACVLLRLQMVLVCCCVCRWCLCAVASLPIFLFVLDDKTTRALDPNPYRVPVPL